MENKLKQEPSHCLKVVLFGPESTGKTTLSEQLASHYNSICVPEYAREYLQQKWNNERKTCEPQDLLPIAIGQIKSENQLAGKTDSVLICDTDLLETKVYSETYYSNTCDPILEKYAIENKVNSKQWHLLTGPTEQIYDLAKQQYFAGDTIGYYQTGNEFLHTENFILVDQKQRIRGVYNGTLLVEIERIKEDIAILKKED